MDALYPTSTLVTLARAIADPDTAVYRVRLYGTGRLVSVWKRPGRSDQVASARCDEMERAGLIRTGTPSGPSMYARRPWELTDAGRRWLAVAETVGG